MLGKLEALMAVGTIQWHYHSWWVGASCQNIAQLWDFASGCIREQDNTTGIQINISIVISQALHDGENSDIKECG